jgi:hypothetical protein
LFLIGTAYLTIIRHSLSGVMKSRFSPQRRRDAENEKLDCDQKQPKLPPRLCARLTGGQVSAVDFILLSSLLEERMKSIHIILTGIVLMTAGCSAPPPQPPAESALAHKIKRYAPAPLTGDTMHLSAGDRQALRKLIEAGRIMDRIYLRQAWSGNEDLYRRLQHDTSAAGREALELFMIEMGPWSSLDHDTAFVAGVPPKPPQANYYPEGMTAEEFNAWVAGLPAAEHAKATGFFWTIRRGPDGTLRTVPYSTEYRDLLGPAAALLNEAVALTDNPSLKKFLSARAAAFSTDDYYASDLAWMDLDSPIDVTIGPYETYMDELFNYKAAFEAFVTLRNDEESRKLQHFSSYLQDIEDHLPIEPKLRNPRLGAMAPIRVVDEVFVGGEASGGVQTAAYNLPNDEKVIKEKGSKRVMLKNVQQAKFQNVLLPIAAVAVDSSQQPLIAFEPFFTHILAHELMHGLGPHNIVVGGKKTTVRQEMKDLYSAIEEAKADIAGLFALQYLIDKGIVEKATEEQMYVTFLAGVFRSVRFGINEAHGKGMALQFNYLLDEGAFMYLPATGSCRVNMDRVKQAAAKLTGEIMTLQAMGDYAGVKAMMDRYAVIRPEMRKVLDRLVTVPVDINPHFPLAGD